jgi:hypothetical protein
MIASYLLTIYNTCIFLWIDTFHILLHEKEVITLVEVNTIFLPFAKGPSKTTFYHLVVAISSSNHTMLESHMPTGQIWQIIYKLKQLLKYYVSPLLSLHNLLILSLESSIVYVYIWEPWYVYSLYIVTVLGLKWYWSKIILISLFWCILCWYCLDQWYM